MPTDAGLGLALAVHIFIQCSLLLVLVMGVGMGKRELNRANSCNLQTKIVMEKHGIVFLDDKTKKAQALLKEKQPLLIKERPDESAKESYRRSEV